MISRFSTLCALLGALALSACGGGANLKFEEQLKADLAASEARVAELTEEVTDALAKATKATEDATEALEDAAAAEVRATEAERRADAADVDVARYRQAADDARQEANDAKAAALLAQQQAQTAQQQAQQAQQAAQQAQQQRQQAQQEADDARQQAQTREANQRAEKLKEAFPGGGLEADLDADDVPDVSTTTSVVSVVSERSRLKLTRGGHRDATLSGSGLRMATMDLTVGGDSGKTVVYTDRELSRSLLAHFGARRDAADMTRFMLADPLAITPFPNPQTSSQWRITHTVPTSVAGVNDDDDASTPLTAPTDAVERNTKTATAFSGSLYGQSGQFVCSGADGCQVTATPTYSSTLENSRFALTTVTVTATGGGTLYFKPSGSPTLQLYEGGPVGPDEEYMVFGYWREDPTSAAADYQANVFASALATTESQAVPGTINASYDGTAVGMYVEQDPNDAVDTHRQGEFTADVSLRISGGAPNTLTGTIDDFVVTPTGGSAEPRTAARWIVELNTGGVAVIDGLTGEKSGNWEHEFVRAHQYAATAVPPAVTGTFNTRILDFVHLLGAFGAEKR